MSEEVKQKLFQLKEFVTSFTSMMNDENMGDSRKQTTFLDNQDNIREAMKSLTDLERVYQTYVSDDNTTTDESKTYELICSLKETLTNTLQSYREGFKEIDPNITQEETTVIVNEKTIEEAVKSNSSTKQIIEDMKSLNTSAPSATHLLIVDGNTYILNVYNKNELVAYINNIVDNSKTPNPSVEVFSLNPIPLKKEQKVVYTV